MAVLITGHKGFIGQNMMAALPGSVGYEWGDGSVSLDGIDRVIHLGAISSTACNDLDRLREQNVAFSIDLLHACAARKIPLQFASSASVYGPQAKTFRETDTPDPQTPYAESKLFLENIILSKGWPMPVQVFRYFNVYGPHEHHKDQPSPYSRFRLQAAATGRVEVFKGSENICRDFVPVEQVIKVHKHFFDLDVSGVYNLGTGIAKSFMDVAREVADDSGAEIVEVPMPLIAGYQRYTCADMTKTLSYIQ
jgi:ADP-L-glycero-D-manno-heptose 6-epimerase